MVVCVWLRFIVIIAVVDCYWMRPSALSTVTNRKLLVVSSLAAAVKQFTSAPAFDIITKNIPLTETLRTRIDGKIGKVVSKLGKDVTSVHVLLKVYQFPVEESHAHMSKKDAQIAEVTLCMKGGVKVHTTQQSENMHSSIDLVAHKLSRAIKRVVGRRRSKQIGRLKHLRESQEREALLDTLTASSSAADEADSAQEEEEVAAAGGEVRIVNGGTGGLLEDLDEKYRAYAESPIVSDMTGDPLQVVRVKSFSMPPISVEDAAAELDASDHPFYLFRNQDSGEVNVIYRRLHGSGLGLIAPSSPPPVE